VNTAKGWLSILEQSYIVFLLRPHFQNFSKRLVKMPKLYFYDTGLACSLLEIENTNMLVNHYLRGGLFENLVIMELLKNRFNEGKTSNIYFWRNNHGNEIDCIIQKANVHTAIEIKSGKTFHPQFLKGLDYWEKLSGNKNEMYLVYGGEIQRNIENKKLIPWQRAGDLILTSY
jgi:predicted AAA+ superfamily ATPase